VFGYKLQDILQTVEKNDLSADCGEVAITEVAVEDIIGPSSLHIAGFLAVVFDPYILCGYFPNQ
jgi:hypothetical protein